MKKLIFIFLIFLNIIIFGKDIYIGDIIRLNITGNNILKKDIQEKFKDFDIINISEAENGYNISIRSFSPGISEIEIGNNILEIEVKSILDKYDQKSIFEENSSGSPSILKPTYPFPATYTAIFLSSIIFILITVLITKFFKMRKSKIKISPYNRFLNSINNIEKGEEFFEISKYLKNYLNERFSMKTDGKSETNLISINPLSEIDDYKNWANEMEHIKFTGKTINEDKKKKLKHQIMEIVDLLESKNLPEVT